MYEVCVLLVYLFEPTYVARVKFFWIIHVDIAYYFSKDFGKEKVLNLALFLFFLT